MLSKITRLLYIYIHIYSYFCKKEIHFLLIPKIHNLTNLLFNGKIQQYTIRFNYDVQIASSLVNKNWTVEPSQTSLVERFVIKREAESMRSHVFISLRVWEDS